MKIRIFLIVIFFSFLLLSLGTGRKHDQITILGATQLNGDGCVCHGLEVDTTVKCWVVGPDTLHEGETALYKMFLTGGPAEGGGYNVAGRFGKMTAADSTSIGHLLAPNELTQRFSLPFPTTQDTIFWAFYYTASDSSQFDTIYSVGLSLVWDSIPDEHDKWNFGPKFPIVVTPAVSVKDDNVIDGFELHQNYPNPFNPATRIRFKLQKAEHVALVIYTLAGRSVRELVHGEMAAGQHGFVWDARDDRGLPVASGVYLCVLRSGSFSAQTKLLLMR